MTPDAIAAEFEPPKKSIRWAEQAIEEFRAAAAAFFKNNTIEVVFDFDAKTGENVYKIRLGNTLDEMLARRATEALTTARHSFDQAVFAARTVTSGKSNKSIYYPWARDPTDLEQLLSRKGIDQRLWGTLKSHEPYYRSDKYTGGNDVIRTLAVMANDKHTIGLEINCHIAHFGYPTIAGVSEQSLKVLVPRWDSKKNEAEIVRWKGDVDVRPECDPRFQIIFRDPRLSQPVDAGGGLVEFASKAKAVVETLQARCMEIAAT